MSAYRIMITPLRGNVGIDPYWAFDRILDRPDPARCGTIK